jgi:hypothetical protein
METILVVVRGGVAYIVEETVPMGISVEVIDFDNLQDLPDFSDPTTPEFSKAARNYIERTDEQVGKMLALRPYQNPSRD